MAGINTRYVSTNRGIIKIIQIIVGFVICSLLCYSWVGGRSCFGEGRVGYASGLNFVIVVINVVLFFVNLLDLSAYKLERLYSVIATILFLVAVVVLIWWLVEYNDQRGRMIGATVLVGVEFLLFLFDVKILQGEIAN